MKCLIIVVRQQRLLIDDPKTEKANFNYVIPIGLAYISAVLKQKNHDVRFLNLNHLDGAVEGLIAHELSENTYECIITGGLSPFYPHIKSVVGPVRKYAPDAKIILGGGLISSQPEIIFNLLEPDFAVIGEGEDTLTELLDCLQNGKDIHNVDGIIYRDPEGNLKTTNPRKPIMDLDSLPWPDYDGLGFMEHLAHMYPSDSSYYDIFDNPRAYPMISSRSCPFSCTFCYHPLGNKYRQRSVGSIMAEIKYAVTKYRINILFFYDELFAHNEDRVSQLCRNIKEFAATLPWELRWVCQMRVDVLDENVVREMKDAGCYFFSLGLESYSLPVLKSMKKKITPAQIDNALHVCKRVGISVTGNFIFGDIAETRETYRETLDYWKNNRDLIGINISLLHIILYQGSYIYKNALKKGIIKDEIQFIEDRARQDYPNPVNFTDSMTDEEFQQMCADLIEANAIPRLYAVPSVNIQTGDHHEIHVKCPVCKETSVYKNYHIPPNFSRMEICCRNCRARFVIPSNRLRLKIIMVNLFGYRMLYSVGKWLYDLSERLPSGLKVRVKKLLAA